MIASHLVIVDIIVTVACSSCATLWLAYSRLQRIKKSAKKKACALERESCFSLARFSLLARFFLLVYTLKPQNGGFLVLRITKWRQIRLFCASHYHEVQVLIQPSQILISANECKISAGLSVPTNSLTNFDLIKQEFNWHEPTTDKFCRFVSTDKFTDKFWLN